MDAEAAHAPDNQPKAKIFISYSRKDMAFADRLEAALKARGFEPLIDRSEIYAFEDWWKRLQSLIQQADTVVFVLSPDAVASREALREVEYAASLNKRFAPIVCRRVEDTAIPEALRRLNFVFFDDQAQLEASAERLAEALRTDIGWIRKHTEYGEAARQWAAAGRPIGLQLRSPALEDAEHWIASRPRGAPEPTVETQIFVADSRRGATRRRNILTGSLAAGLVIALGLAGVAYWQRGIAVQQRQIADQQRKRAEDTLAAATRTANSLVFDLAQKFRFASGIPVTLIKDILDRAIALQQQLVGSGQITSDLEYSEAAALQQSAFLLQALGDTTGAYKAADRSRQIMERLVASAADRLDWRENLSIIYATLGRVFVDMGKRDEALATYQKSKNVIAALLSTNPGNTNWQRELSAIDNRIGDVLVSGGRRDGALAAYQDGLAIMKTLTAGNLDNMPWQRDFAVSYEKVGELFASLGKRPEALANYHQALEIMQALADKTPENSEAQRDLSLFDNKIGDLLLAMGQNDQALTAYQKGLTLIQKLATSDPANAEWQDDLSVSYEKLGDGLLRSEQAEQALATYQKSRQIRQKLTDKDPNNAMRKRDLSVSDDKIGDAEYSLKRLDGALQAYRRGLVVRQQLVNSDPSNAGWLHDLHFDCAADWRACLQSCPGTRVCHCA